nr:P-loop NTPase domain-containing protein LPA1 homolog 1-like [Ipomoea batatas]
MGAAAMWLQMPSLDLDLQVDGYFDCFVSGEEKGVCVLAREGSFAGFSVRQSKQLMKNSSDVVRGISLSTRTDSGVEVNPFGKRAEALKEWAKVNSFVIERLIVEKAHNNVVSEMASPLDQQISSISDLKKSFDQTDGDKFPVQDKDKLRNNLKIIQDYLCSFGSQGLIVANTSAAAFPQALDWLHNYLLQRIEEGISSIPSGNSGQAASD